MYNKNIFIDINTADSFQRVDIDHPLDLYIGIDGESRRTLFLISDDKPSEMPSSQVIRVSVGQRNDKKWALSFILVDDQFEELFIHFCNDIVESSRFLEDKARGAEYVSGRYSKWQNMLAKQTGDLLSASAIKGLVGELCFLKNFLIPHYGQTVAINAWIGPDRADQDFVCNDTWYEVKATVSGSESVTIASVEQLDMPNVGELAIVYLDKTSKSNSTKVTLNSVFGEISNSLESEELKQRFSGILLNLGYYVRQEYNEPVFSLSKIESYRVDNMFPCIRRKDLPAAVINSKYTLSLSAITNYLKES